MSDDNRPLSKWQREALARLDAEREAYERGARIGARLFNERMGRVMAAAAAEPDPTKPKH